MEDLLRDMKLLPWLEPKDLLLVSRSIERRILSRDAAEVISPLNPDAPDPTEARRQLITTLNEYLYAFSKAQRMTLMEELPRRYGLQLTWVPPAGKVWIP